MRHMCQDPLENRPEVTVQVTEVNRVLDVGRLLLATLTEEELAELIEQCSEGFDLEDMQYRAPAASYCTHDS